MIESTNADTVEKEPRPIITICIQAAIFILSILTSALKLPNSYYFHLLELMCFVGVTLNQYFFKGNNAFFPKGLFNINPKIVLLSLVIIGCIPTMLNGRIIDVNYLHQNIENIILCPLLIYSLIDYIGILNRKYHVLKSVNIKKLGFLSLLILTLTFLYGLFFSTYYPDTSDLLAKDKVIVISEWINLFNIVVNLYFSINCILLIIVILKEYTFDSTMNIGFADLFPMKAFLVYSALIIVFGASFLFSGHAVEIVLEFAWLINLAVFIPLTYEINALLSKLGKDGARHIVLFKCMRLKANHFVFILSVFIALYSIVMRWVCIKTIYEGKVIYPGIQLIGLSISFLLMLIIGVSFYMGYKNSTSKS